MSGNNTGTAIVGGDWPNALPVTTYAEPKPKQTGLDWGKLCPPAETTPPVVSKPRCDVCGAALTAGKCARCIELEEARRDATFIQPKLETDTEPVAKPVEADVATPEVIEPAPGAMWNLPTPSVQFEWAQLLAGTADSTERTIVSARFLALAALEHLRLSAAAATPRESRVPRTSRVRHSSVTPDDVADIVARYRAGASIQQIARDVHRRKDRVSEILKDAGVVVRGRGGGNAIDLDAPETIETARRLYIDEHLTIQQASDRMGMSSPTFSKLMSRHGIRVLRKGSSADRLVGYRARLADLGVTSADVREWWEKAGHRPALSNGPIPAYALDAYEEAHR